jgi:hypothetical protein
MIFSRNSISRTDKKNLPEGKASLNGNNIALLRGRWMEHTRTFIQRSKILSRNLHLNLVYKFAKDNSIEFACDQKCRVTGSLVSTLHSGQAGTWMGWSSGCSLIEGDGKDGDGAGRAASDCAARGLPTPANVRSVDFQRCPFSYPPDATQAHPGTTPTGFL